MKPEFNLGEVLTLKDGRKFTVGSYELRGGTLYYVEKGNCNIYKAEDFVEHKAGEIIKPKPATNAKHSKT